MSYSPRSDGGGSPGSPRTPTALRNEIAAARQSIFELKVQKEDVEDKLNKTNEVLEKERGALRDVLSAAKLKVDNLNTEIKAKDDEIERLKALLASQQTTNS